MPALWAAGPPAGEEAKFRALRARGPVHGVDGVTHVRLDQVPETQRLYLQRAKELLEFQGWASVILTEG